MPAHFVQRIYRPYQHKQRQYPPQRTFPPVGVFRITVIFRLKLHQKSRNFSLVHCTLLLQRMVYRTHTLLIFSRIIVRLRGGIRGCRPVLLRRLSIFRRNQPLWTGLPESFTGMSNSSFFASDKSSRSFTITPLSGFLPLPFLYHLL